MSTEMDSNKIRHAVKLKVMNLIARREHSEKELREKLTTRFLTGSEVENLDFIETVIDETLQLAKERNWLAAPEEAALRISEGLHQRNRGIHYINEYLAQKGLPAVAVNDEQELAKARAALKNKFSAVGTPAAEDQNKLMRFLSTRGFDIEIVRKVLNEKLRDQK